MAYFINYQKHFPEKDYGIFLFIGAYAVLATGSFINIWGNHPNWFAPFELGISSTTLLSIANILYLVGTIAGVIGLILWSKSVIALHTASAEAKDFRNQVIDQNELLREKTRDLEIQTVDYFEQREAALESERSKINFLRNTSHELRTPLNAIIGLSELLANYSVESEKERKEFANMILDSGKNLLSTIDTILEIARINSSEYAPSLLSRDINTVLSDCITQCLPKAHSKSIRIEAPSKDSPLAYATFDRKALHQILTDVLDNALTYSPGETTVFITIDLSEEGYVTIVIKDQGPGIPEEFMKTIFEIFGRAEHWQNRGVGNSGFGLALAKKMIEIQKGKLQVISDGKFGTTVYVSLPASLPATQ
ncbi:MAG: HAMP domain-containing histidine kinase [Sneathiella sp.]|nr:HAMP domain-containing histidine kinase [Sneathiella sp.]